MQWLLIVSLLLSVWLPVAVLANPFGTVDPPCSRFEVCFNEGPHQRYWYGFTHSGWISAANEARTTDIGPTDMSTSGVQSHSDSDVATYLYNDPNDPFFSYVECIDWTNEVCHHWHVNFNQGQGPYTQGERDSLACHEFGHTTGLHHYGSHQFIATCMENVDWHQNFNSHDVTHINNRYEEGEVTMGHRIQWVALSVMIGMLLPAFASCADDPDPRGTAREGGLLLREPGSACRDGANRASWLCH